MIHLLIVVAAVVWNEDDIVIHGTCRQAVEQNAGELFLDFRFPEVHEINGNWRVHGAAYKVDPACKIANLNGDETADYAAILLSRRSATGFALFAITSFRWDGTVGYDVYPLHAERRGVFGERLLLTTKRKMLRDDSGHVIIRDRGWLQIRAPNEGYEFRWCRNLDNPLPRRGIDSIEYVLATDSEKSPTRLARFHWNTAGLFTRRSYCR